MLMLELNKSENKITAGPPSGGRYNYTMDIDSVRLAKEWPSRINTVKLTGTIVYNDADQTDILPLVTPAPQTSPQQTDILPLVTPLPQTSRQWSIDKPLM